MRHEKFAPGQVKPDADDVDDERPNLAMAAVIVAWVITPVVVAAAVLSGAGLLGSILTLVLAPPVVFAVSLVGLLGVQVLRRR